VDEVLLSSESLHNYVPHDSEGNLGYDGEDEGSPRATDYGDIGQMAASRECDFNELPTAMRMSVYYVSSDPLLTASLNGNGKRN
jgi:hypothetical protein